ncbi:MAG: hypothetical protein A3G20_01710 [Acidobacteria bacterium RIFCSPLOWO2_12_FULL_59_11]|nr:MAG: hypothetical protein A3G20_01710 [Acidobacteria bacterium RIFCSPLOWO2_12_FULL_59_11]
MTSAEFLNLLWRDKPENLYILIWTLADKRSRWFQDVLAAGNAVELASRSDVYVGVGLAHRDYGPAHRCVSDEIAGLVGFWADLDLRSDAHNKKTLPATFPDALSIIPELMPPTIVVSTGNGAHTWWLFKEPYLFDNVEDRKGVAKLVARWQTLLRYRATQRGWAFDRLSDLARVLRIPGTINAKDPNNPKEVTVHSTTGRRYNLSDFEEFLDEASIPDPEAQERDALEWAERIEDRPLLINFNARIPNETIEGWMAQDMRFKNTWLRQRHDLKDHSQSGYDMALADFGVGAGLSEQQIVDFIITHRAKHGQSQRRRADYFQRTIAKAFERSGPSTTEAKVQQEGPPGTQDEGRPKENVPSDPATAKALLCEQISRVLGIVVVRLVKLSGKNPIFHMELETGKIEFTRVDKLIDQRSVRNAIAGAVGVLIPKFKSQKWDPLAQMMLDACMVEDGGEEASFEGAARMHVENYLAETSFIPSPEGQPVQSAPKPMIHKEKIAICSGDLQMYVNKTTGQNLSVMEIVSMLKALGSEPGRVRGRKFKEQSRWLLPLEEFDPADYCAREREPGDDVE